VRIGEGFDQVTARAVSALKTLIPLTVPLVRPGGEIIVMKGKGAEAEIEAAARQIRAYRLQDIEVLTLGEGILSEVTRVVRATVN
jgi:16S rRNA (guanine527-N7)-methyltransferase